MKLITHYSFCFLFSNIIQVSISSSEYGINHFFFFKFQINIDFQTKTLIAQNIQEATSGCFTTAQKRVYSLMENNSYPRFLESEFYQDLCKKPQITTEPHAT